MAKCMYDGEGEIFDSDDTIATANAQALSLKYTKYFFLFMCRAFLLVELFFTRFCAVNFIVVRVAVSSVCVLKCVHILYIKMGKMLEGNQIILRW